MPALPKEVQDSPTVRAIYAAYEARDGDSKPRRYLGASVIGKPCARALWYDFRWCGQERFDGRMLRLFETGNLSESRFVANLRSIGCEVHEFDPVTRGQFAVSTLGGHVRGHMDGCAVGIPESPKTWHVCEFKTHGNKSFTALRNQGVQKAKPEHFAQMMLYMHLTGMDRAFYLAVNKDTDELYSERVKYDLGEASRILAKAQQIIEANEPPEKIADSREKFPCMFCHHADRCHGAGPDAPVVPSNVTCRSCCHSTPIIEGDAGSWRCEHHEKLLSEPEQERACEDHIFMPSLVTCARPIDSDGESVEYEMRDGEGEWTWKNGRKAGQYTSGELTTLTISALGNKAIQDIKQHMGGTVVADADLPFRPDVFAAANGG